VALNVADQRRFRQWIIKCLSGPGLALGIFFLDQVIGNPRDLLHLTTLGVLLFAGFPLWNIILEPDRARLGLFHGTHFLIFISPLCLIPSIAGPAWLSFWVPDAWNLGQQGIMIPPVDMMVCLVAWLWGEAGLTLLMPGTAERVTDLKNWRRSRLEKIVEAHYAP